jgi:hypothetical protein
MSKVLMILAAAFAMAALQPAAARDAPTITKAETRSLPPAVVKRRVMEQLGDILTGDRYTARRPPVRPLTDLSFHTRPRATAVPGLCQVDWLTISFRSEAGEPRDADTPATADGVSVTHHFLFRKPPTGEYREIADHGRTPDDARCRSADWRKDAFFSAPDDSIATDGYLLAYRAMDAIVAGKPPFPFACEKWPVEAERDCAGIVREIRSAGLSAIETCEVPMAEPSATACYAIDAGERALRIVSGHEQSGPDRRAAPKILRLALTSPIILIHERVE